MTDDRPTDAEVQAAYEWAVHEQEVQRVLAELEAERRRQQEERESGA